MADLSFGDDNNKYCLNLNVNFSSLLKEVLKLISILLKFILKLILMISSWIKTILINLPKFWNLTIQVKQPGKTRYF